MIIGTLSQNLQEDIKKNIYSDMLKKFQLFDKHFSPAFLNALALRVKEKKYGQDEVIYQQNQPADAIYYLISGEGIPIFGLLSDAPIRRCILLVGWPRHHF